MCIYLFIFGFIFLCVGNLFLYQEIIFSTESYTNESDPICKTYCEEVADKIFSLLIYIINTGKKKLKINDVNIIVRRNY
jgi:hypothetical protein